MEGVKAIISLLGVILSGAALYLAYNSNQISIKNQQKIERIECFDKIENKTSPLYSLYLDAHVSATIIYNDLKDKKENKKEIYEFQRNISKAGRIATNIKNLAKRFGTSCKGTSHQILEDVQNLSKRMSGNGALSQFGGYNEKLQKRHQKNTIWLYRNLIADYCCPN